ncbi:MAG: DEAD/DEAH box helicase [Chloroflexi bacterium]|nr:DEAD/DEAH box helicase [Chloroflexota bacterium]
MTTFVALDLETTGLDPDRDTIIEIGAVKFTAKRIEGEYSTLINPGRPIPKFIENLTGISDAMVAKAPLLREALPKLVEFVGDGIIVGHSIKFDLGFLHKQRLFKDNNSLDTYDLAAVLMPAAGRYSLGALAQATGIILPATHRALDDARVSQALYRKLFERALALPLDVLAEIVNVGQEIRWGGDLFFEEALAARSKEKMSGPLRVSHERVSGPLFADKEPVAPRPLKPAETRKPLDLPALSALLSPGGAFEKNFPSFEHRTQQVQMLEAVAEAFNNGGHLMVEAGTGTGKSVAYLLPAIHWAAQNDERVIVSTNTINLQDQLINKDVPTLREVLGFDFRAALLKGRSNYICPRRFESIRRRGPRNADEMRLLAKLLVWLPESRTGDVGEITLSGPGERGAWTRMSAEDENCTNERCASQMAGICPLYRAKQAAAAAHVIIVNHALLLADVATGSQVLPAYNYLVVDEGHHLEAATTDGLSFRAAQSDVERSLKELGGPNSGVLGQTLKACRDSIPPEAFVLVQTHVEKTYNAISTALVHTGNFFQIVGEFLKSQRGDDNGLGYAQQLRIVPGVRSQSGWSEVEVAWGNLDAALKPVREMLVKLAGGLSDLSEYEIEEREDVMSQLTSVARTLDEFATQTNGLVSKPDPKQIYWIESRGDDEKLSLHVAPLNVGPLLEQHLWRNKESVIVTSATLTTAGEFDYLKKRLNAESAGEVAVGSPFDYQSSTLLYVINDIPEPSDRQGHQRALENGLIALCKATKGRAMALFTANAQMKQTAQAIRGPLERAGVVVYDQTEGASRHQLLESFRSADQAVLLGTRSFWEGVDVAGEALSVLAIAKLPFDVPSDPIIAARAETFENSFMEYSVPEAILRFRQGFGRLIRSKQDRGVVVIFDSRVITKRYGRLFIDSLPNCTRRDGPLANLPALAAKWIDGK